VAGRIMTAIAMKTILPSYGLLSKAIAATIVVLLVINTCLAFDTKAQS